MYEKQGYRIFNFTFLMYEMDVKGAKSFNVNIASELRQLFV
jgi:hypothetical protein